MRNTPNLPSTTAFDSGAKRILLPMASVRDISTSPGELLAKFQTGFYADPVDAVCKALGVQKIDSSVNQDDKTMTNSFLLRFQERPKNPSNSQAGTGTETSTYVQTEQADTDPHECGFRIVPNRPGAKRHSNSQVLAGTKTITEVRQESADNDPTKRQFDSLPKV